MELDDGYYGSPRWTYEILDCAMPMTFDTYSNCAHQCLYCFSFFQRAIGIGADDYLHHKVRSVNVEKIKRMFLDPSAHAGQFANYIKRRMVLQWGGLSDGFDYYEKKFRKSLDLLRFFREIDYPISISTKGVWWIDDPEYQEVVRGALNMHWKYSIITSNEQHVKELEPGVPPARERFRAMEKLNALGVGATTLRFRPFVIGTSDLCIDEMMQLAKDSGCYSVTTEFLTWESRASNTSKARLDAMSKTLGYDVWQFYIENSARASGLLRLNYDLKRPYIKKMKEKAEELDLKFFVSDAHHKEDSYHAGCCGLPESGPLSNVNRGQYAHAIKLAKVNGFVKWSDISDEAHELLKDIPLIRAEGFPSDTVERAKRHYQSMYDYMHDIWNNPKSWQSPARYFGGALVPSAPDEAGDIVYLYNKPFIEQGTRINSVSELAIQLNMVGKPNADRFDEAVKDGSDFGHVAYPIAVFSKGRADFATTPKLLDEARLQNWFFVVQKEEVETYTDRYPNADIVVLPENCKDITSSREYIYQMYKEDGYPYIWMLDDDITAFTKREQSEGLLQWKICSPRALFSGIERFLEEYENVALLSVPSNSAAFGKSYELNFWDNIRSLYLVNLQTGMSFFNASKVREMEYFAVKHLATGKWVTISHWEYEIETDQEAAMPGGCLKDYLAGEQRKAVVQMKSEFPDYVEAEQAPKPFELSLKQISKPFTALRARAATLLTEGEGK